ncbi:glutamine amidotransferase [Thermoflavifilum aggregans]|uniref:Imidazole glycerol phosphate synthase subunit HisH n=1 Tax=Thermoflavifilum aggregans TaxID=454188 RepID=A0A2M9CWL8_9BACT|nr:imidazole glycerol phosphate synthase subunit HisH [Thermoflavifilum aggregans]MBX6380855.1 imidazole glycerol phosphate synthase subunit HisH [Thermoflavifilum aggregans]PJJ76279.1 glutamine amidotransferase [Thermoflavifilum aggregans]
MEIAVIRYHAGNIQSVLFALERMGYHAHVTDDAGIIGSADRVIFPGVGEASSAMAYLKARKLDEVIRSLTQPVLGICLGMQLMARHSEENNTPCLDIFPEEVKKFSSESGLKVPQIGWNQITQLHSPLFEGVKDGSYVYFVHSYYVPCCAYTIATASYGITYSAAIQRDHFYAVQFHPEKSAEVGERILRNFIHLS